MMPYCQESMVVLMLGAILFQISSTLSQVTETCSAAPSALAISYNFDVSGTSYRVCPTSDFRSDDRSHRWVFRPASVDARGTYTVSETDLRSCVYNVSSSQRLELVVTPPSDQNESGDFVVTFVPETGNTTTLAVSYRPTGFYREVNESTVQSPSFTEPLWRSIGLELSDVTTVCQQDGSGVLENVTFLDADANADASLCLPGFGGFGNFIFANPLYISLGIGEEVQIPDDLIGRRLSFVLVTGTCQNPMIRSEPVIITVLNATIPAPVSPSPSPLPSPSSVPTVTTTSPPSGNNAGLIAGVVIGLLLLIVVVFSVVLGVVYGFLHLNKIRKNSLSRRASRASLSRQSSAEKGQQPLTPNLEHEAEPQNRDLTHYAPSPVPVADPIRASPPAPSPVELTDSGGNYIIVVTPFQKVAEHLARTHGLSLQPLTTSEQTRVLNGYSHHVSSALADSMCHFVYFIWNYSLEDTSSVPLSDLVRELVSRPLPSAELKKVVFVQLGSKSKYPLSENILQFALEVSPSNDNFNPEECARLIYDKVPKEVDSDVVDGLVQRTTRTVGDEITPTDTSAPKYHTLQSPPPPSYNATVHPDDPRSRSLPPSVERTRATERLRTAEPSSADSSPLIGILETSKELLKEFRGFRSTQEQAIEKEAARSKKKIKLMEQEAVRSERRTKLGEKQTELMEQEATKSEERNEKLVAAVDEVGADVKQVAGDVQNIGDRLDEETIEDESKMKSFSS